MTLLYRKERISKILEQWGGNKVNDFFAEWEIPKHLFEELRLSICLYISKAMEFEYTSDGELFIQRLNNSRGNRKNITPNGGVVPKKEYQLEYNLFLRSWCSIVKVMIQKDPRLLRRFRLTPNIRIKFALELEENVGRGLDTAIPHSDAWVEGPWGMNCHLPIIGDYQKNYLHFYKLKDESEFSEDFLTRSTTYNDMQWVVEKYIDDDIIPKMGFISISDYALIHGTKRLPGCDTRVSIDTTVFIGDHDVHPDRRQEYMDEIPSIGEDLFISTDLHSGEVANKKSTFSHYTSGSLKHNRLD
jgi:hypothetical protein